MQDHDPFTTAPPTGPHIEGGDDALPERIGRYRVERILGEGGFGRVYLAHDDQLRRLVAIKVPHPRLLAQAGDAEAYLTEARTVAGLDHPNIVPVYDVGSTEQFPCFVVSKYIDGADLASRLKQSRLSLHEAVDLAATVAEALHHAHKQGLVHRDIKPGNLLLDKVGKPFVADFGLALREQDVGKGPRYAGTPAYMSPEQARAEGHRVDGRSDVFSLGVVFYELLVGRRPFHGDTRDELLEQIVSVEARPLRMIDDAIPKELERICLKALSKRASERFTTAKDMADDLRHFLAGSSAEERATVTGRGGSLADVATAATPSDQQAARIVPKGLRSFDAHDADFFLELLPGPRDRDGLPDSIRFWKARIEEQDPERTFCVGLLYGPSGCGKSSLVKAGLLPRLAKPVTAVYVEATGEETEARLLKGLRRGVPDLPNNLGLIESLAAVRQGRLLEPGRKVLLVLDQFEQWLHARRNDENTELVQSLRQCDGGRVQCVVMVRDDFGMAATRFMAALDIPIVQGNNFATVDLFDPIHARKVLAAFGRAYGRLPDNLRQCSKEQDAFLDQAVAGLAQDGKVVSVRLALFAEMVKGKPWAPATLKEVGGTEGVGVTFLEETFTASTAPPPHRLHQKAAQAVLKALLPEAGTDIKGHMRSRQELLEASGYAGRPRDFDELIRILDGEIRLITPTDPEGKEGAEPSAVRPGEKYYQLTHDYLVPSLREWLSRKQKETRRGRAELRLAERAAAWNSKPEGRHLPAWWEWATIRLFTRKKEWTVSQRKMMAKAGRFHAVRALGLAMLVAVVTLAGLFVRSEFTQQKKATHAAGLVQRLLDADTAQVPGVIDEMEGYRQWADPLLRQEYEEAKDGSRQKLHASLALLPVDEGQVDHLYRRLLDASPTQLGVIRDALAGHKGALTGRLWGVLGDERQDADRRLRAACALAGYGTAGDGRWRKASPRVVARLLASVQKNPSHYTPVLELLRPVRGELLGPLAKVCRGKGRSESERSWATTILADYAANRPRELAELLMDGDEKQFAILFPKVESHRERAVPLLGETVKTPLESKKTDEEKEILAKRQANAAVALLRLGRAEQTWPVLKHRGDPRARSYLIHRLAPLGADPAALVRRLDRERDASIRRALLLSLGEYGLPAGERGRLVPLVLRLYREEPDAGLHGAAEWLLRRWEQQGRLKEWEKRWARDRRKRKARLVEIRKEAARKEGRGEGYWYVNGQGQTMVVVPGPVTFRMGSPVEEAGREGGPEGKIETPHRKRIGRTFAIASHEVTVGQFLAFRRDHPYNEEDSPSKDHPVNAVPWYDAAAYCNWLSDREGIAEGQWCYEPKKGKDVRDWSKEAYGDGMRLKADYLSLEGYRLPSEAEWEAACRAGSAASRYYGETEELLGKYAWYTKVSQDRGMLPVGSLKPNDLGLFDMLGNALEWCQERPSYYRPGLTFRDDKEDTLSIDRDSTRVLRGGSFGNQAGFVRSAGRYRYVPANRVNLVGFRPARTFR
jgi:serine/threonine protein kinase/formylglycine-generating enzyme required for sulfatase activity